MNGGLKTRTTNAYWLENNTSFVIYPYLIWIYGLILTARQDGSHTPPLESLPWITVYLISIRKKK